MGEYYYSEEHETDSEDCWCVPDRYQLCPVCNGKRCGYCNQGGWVAPYDDHLPLVIVHHSVLPDNPGEEQ